MKRFWLVVVNIVIGVVAVFAQTGTWSGNLDIQGTKLPIVFHLDADKPTMDSPAQGVNGIPMTFNKGDDGKISLAVPMAGISYEGKLENGQIVGVFKQRGMEFPLTMKSGVDKPKRPQTPDGTGPYIEEQVTFSNGDATLKGTLTLPNGYNKKTPVLVMVTGSGLQNRDEELHEHKPFAVIADALARNGIATLRYDDRGFGESTGDAVNCTTEDLMYDALAGVNLLRKRFKKVGVLGHSEGGTIALMLGADKKVDFAVSLAGMVISGKELLLAQNQLALTQAGIPEATVNEYCDLLTKIFDNDKDIESQLEASQVPEEFKQNLRVVVKQMQSPYMRYVVDLDLRERLGKIKCPVLALNGTKDTQVMFKENLDALRQGLPKNPKNKIHEVDGLNHMFQHCDTGSILEYATIEETISPDILATISAWIQTTTN